MENIRRMCHACYWNPILKAWWESTLAKLMCPQSTWHLRRMIMIYDLPNLLEQQLYSPDLAVRHQGQTDFLFSFSSFPKKSPLTSVPSSASLACPRAWWSRRAPGIHFAVVNQAKAIPELDPNKVQSVQTYFLYFLFFGTNASRE